MRSEMSAFSRVCLHLVVRSEKSDIRDKIYLFLSPILCGIGRENKQILAK